MGWFAINILLPVLAPLALLFVAGKICAPIEPFSSRMKLLRTVSDGQLGWAAVVFSASASYELFLQIQSNTPPSWAGLTLGTNIFILVISGMTAVLGALFPTKEPAARFNSMFAWTVHYRTFCISIFVITAAGTMFCKVHFALETACK
jgi:hypothetical protein